MLLAGRVSPRISVVAARMFVALFKIGLLAAGIL